MNILLSRLTTGVEAVYVLLPRIFIGIDISFICRPPQLNLRQFKDIVDHSEAAAILISHFINAFVTNFANMGLETRLVFGFLVVLLIYELALGPSL